MNTAPPIAPITYEQYKAMMQDYLTQACRYDGRAGSSYFVEKMAALEDAYPDHAAALDAES